jgi:alpha-N-arabinofuranosidase
MGKDQRAMGHPEPFNMKYLGIGNEQWGPQYFERYLLFEKAIKSKYPEIKLVSGTGPQPDDDLFDYAIGALKDLDPYLVDEHYYRPPSCFRKTHHAYDNYVVTVIRYLQVNMRPECTKLPALTTKTNWDCALSEAAFMTDLNVMRM